MELTGGGCISFRLTDALYENLTNKYLNKADNHTILKEEEEIFCRFRSKDFKMSNIFDKNLNLNQLLIFHLLQILCRIFKALSYLTFFLLHSFQLDWVSPVDTRPFTD